jgi:hypothetical protein
MIEKEFAAFLRPEVGRVPHLSLRMGVITVHDNVNKRVSLNIGGDSSVVMTSVPYLHSYAPSIGDFVLVLVQDAALVVLGNIQH